MANNASKAAESAIGTDIVTIKHGDNVSFRSYLVDRPAPSERLRAAEAALDITITVARPVSAVWPVFSNFNLWMSRFGYVWDDGVPAEKENGFATLRNAVAAKDLAYGAEGSTNRYVVRKVVKEQLILFDSYPYRPKDKDLVFTGHNLMSLNEAGGKTTISVFMEHTWYSETLPLEALRAEGRKLMFEDGVAFWRDYLIPDLLAGIAAGG